MNVNLYLTKEEQEKLAKAGVVDPKKWIRGLVKHSIGRLPND